MQKTSNYPIPTPLEYYKYGDKIFYLPSGKSGKGWMNNGKKGVVMKGLNEKTLRNKNAFQPNQIPEINEKSVIIKTENNGKLIKVTNMNMLMLSDLPFRGGKSRKQQKSRKASRRRLTRRRK